MFSPGGKKKKILILICGNEVSSRLVNSFLRHLLLQLLIPLSNNSYEVLLDVLRLISLITVVFKSWHIITSSVSKAKKII